MTSFLGDLLMYPLRTRSHKGPKTRQAIVEARRFPHAFLACSTVACRVSGPYWEQGLVVQAHESPGKLGNTRPESGMDLAPVPRTRARTNIYMGLILGAPGRAGRGGGRVGRAGAVWRRYGAVAGLCWLSAAMSPCSLRIGQYTRNTGSRLRTWLRAGRAQTLHSLTINAYNQRVQCLVIYRSIAL